MPHADPTLSVAERVDAACDRFESEWKGGVRPKIDDYVAAAPESDREELRHALLALEVELQGRSEADTSVTRSSVRADGKLTPMMTVDHVQNPARPVKTIGRFELRGVLGSGAFGKVYRAFDPQLGREVAVKVPLASTVQSEKERAQFLKEARSAANINHPNVCPVHEVGEADGRPYIVMALVRGSSLADTLKARNGPLPEKQAALVIRKIALALAAAHDSGIVHRDLKPANVMFDRERKDIVVMDFGLARGPRLGDARGTQSGVIMGTPAYMSPEQARGDSKGVGPAGDIFSLGVILYELLAGARPFTGTATEVIGQILHVEPEKPSTVRPDIDPRLESVCLKAMAKDPAARFASMKEFAAALDAVLRKPAPTSPAVETAKANTTRREGEDESTGTSNNLAEVFAVLSADRKQARAETAAVVEGAIAKHRTPRWVLVLAGLLLVGGLTALAGIVFYTKSDKVKVTIELTDVDLSDKSLRFFLDEEPVSAEALANPIELVPGEHVLVVKRGKEVVKRMLLTVSGGRRPGIKVKDITPPPAVEPPKKGPAPSPAATDRELAEWFVRNDCAVLPAAGDLPTTDEQLMAAGPWITRPEDLPAGPFKLIGVGQSQPFRHVNREVIRRFSEAKNLRWIGMYACPEFDDAGLEAVADCREVIWLRAEANNKVTDAALKHLAGMKKLKRLELSYSVANGSGLKDMPDAPLEWLSLHGAGSGTPESVRAICQFKRLQLLWVRSDECGDAEARQLFRSLPELREVTLEYARLTDAGLADVAGAANLTGLGLKNTRVTGDGLRHLALLPRLRVLGLGNTPVRDEGLAHLRRVPRLAELRLDNTGVTDAGLAHLAGAAELEELHLTNTVVTDTGAKLLAGLPKLRRLHLDGTRITDEGLRHLGECRSLQGLWVNNTAVSDVGLEHLKKVPQLAELGLAKTKVTDAGLKHLEVIRTLRTLDLQNTAITNDGLLRLKKALPDCQITPELKAMAGTDRAAAEWALRVGGHVEVATDAGATRVTRSANLPPGPFRLTRIELRNVKEEQRKVTLGPEGLAPLAGLKHLVELDLIYCGVPDEDFRHVAGLTTLEHLDVWDARLTDAGMARLARLINLKHLGLVGCPITGAGFESLKGMTAARVLNFYSSPVDDAGMARLPALPNVDYLGLDYTKISDAGLVHLKRWPTVTSMKLNGTGVTDAGLDDVAGLKSLRRVELMKTKVTAAGIRKLQERLPNCDMYWGGRPVR